MINSRVAATLRFWIGIYLCGLCGVTGALAASGAQPARPNILWIVAEDINPQLSCFGDTNAVTPNLDRFAGSALRYPNCWSTAPVCGAARTSLITGVYATSLGAEHMRSEVAMPSWMRMYPQFLREAGYYCSNNSKEDYNLTKPGKVWDESSPTAHWRNRKPGQPFMAVFNIGITHESQIRTRPHTFVHDPAKMRLPAYHPDTPEVRQDWAQYYDNITTMDGIFAEKLKELEDAGLAEDTIVFFYGDNGGGMPRSKRWPYNSGLNVPLIVRVPEKFKALAPKDYLPGGVSERLLGFVDFAPTLLSIAGTKPPEWMQGRAFMGEFATPAPEFIHGFRGRMDERCDMVRATRDQRFIYIRNYAPQIIYGQYIAYMFETPTTRVWKKLYDEGKLKPPQTFFWETKPAEELYDLKNDPDEVKNLANSPEHLGELNKLRGAQQKHLVEIRDAGFLTEAEQHRRAAPTMYEAGHDDKRYPLVKIMGMAERATGTQSATVEQLKAGLKDTDGGVRYWAAQGLQIRGAEGVKGAREELQQALNDGSPSVRIAAATALGKYGDQADLNAALETLKAMASPVTNGAYVAIESLNAMTLLGTKAEPLMAYVKAMPTRDPAAPERANTYVPRLVEDFSGKGWTEGPAAAKKKGKRKGNNAE